MAKNYTPPDQSGRVTVVTGASSGIGLWTALGLARAGATVLLVCRSRERGEAAQAMVARETGKAAPALFLADFASLRAVDDLATAILIAYPALHLLVNNAGVFVYKRETTTDGYEKTFAVNHLAPFHLTNRLLGALRAGAGGLPGSPARVVNVSSAVAARAVLNFDDLMAAKKYDTLTAYGQSKLANILHANELSRRVSGEGITANSLHPGAVSTALGDTGVPTALGLLWKLMKPFLLTSEQGAVNSLFIATAPELAGTSGAYFDNMKVATTNPLATDERVASRLWQESDALVRSALGTTGR